MKYDDLADDIPEDHGRWVHGEYTRSKSEPKLKKEFPMTPKTIKRSVLFGALAIFALITGLNTVYIVPEGHVAVVKHTGEAVRQEEPGLKFKTPYLENTIEFEVRERKTTRTLAGATGNQLPVTAIVSINWTVNRSAAIDLYKQYGGIEQFETRVLNPRMESAAKAAIAHFRADEIIRDRQTVVADIFKEIKSVTSTLPINITTAQLEDITLPEIYMNSILAKEKAREDAEREKHTLVQQKLIAQQEVQSAEAERDANMARADGNAYRTLKEATSEAKAIALIQEQLAKSPVYVDLVRAKAWNGVRSHTVLGSDTNLLVGVGTGNMPAGGTK